MKLLGFMTMGKKIVKIEINGKILRWFDDEYPEGIQIIPKDMKLITKMLRFGKPTLKERAMFIIGANAGENLKEYEACCLSPNPEEALADMVRREAKDKALLEVK